MAVGWMAVLKLVPWVDVIAATPQLVQASKRLLKRAPKDGPAAAQSDPDPQQRLALLEQEHHASTLLIAQLVAQNAQIVQAVEALRRRCQQLLWALVLLGSVSVALWLRGG